VACEIPLLGREPLVITDLSKLLDIAKHADALYHENYRDRVPSQGTRVPKTHDKGGQSLNTATTSKAPYRGMPKNMAGTSGAGPSQKYQTGPPKHYEKDFKLGTCWGCGDTKPARGHSLKTCPYTHPAQRRGIWNAFKRSPAYTTWQAAKAHAGPRNSHNQKLHAMEVDNTPPIATLLGQMETSINQLNLRIADLQHGLAHPKKNTDK
jgi:hypothetical protein